jgi:hypothetical protein
MNSSDSQFMKKRRRGLSSVVGALLFVVLMVSTFAVLGVALDSQTDIVSTGRDVSDLDLKKQQEDFIIHSIIQNTGDFLQINLVNRGQNPAEIFTVIITNSTDIANGFPTNTFEIPSETSFLPPGKDDPTNIVSTLGMKLKIPNAGTENYDFKVISSLGTIRHLVVVCDSDTNSCGPGASGGGTGSVAVQLLLDGPNGVNTKNSTAVMFVTNTGNVPLKNVTPVNACSDMWTELVDGAGLGDMNPCILDTSSPKELAVGQTVLFPYDMTVAGDVDDEFSFCNGVTAEETDGTPTPPSNIDCDRLTVIDPNDCGGCEGGEGGAKLILVDDLLTRPSLFMTIPSPFGEEAEGGAVWGVNLVNPTEVNMTVSKLTIVVYPPTANDNDKILVKDTSGSTCVVTEIFPTDGNWSCPKDNTILWQNLDNPLELPARTAKEMLVKVEPGAANTNIDALIVQANVFTTLGSFGKGEGYQSTMRNGATPLVNVFLQHASTPDRDDFHGVLNNGITEMQSKEFYVSLADMDDTDTTYIETGARVIINVPRDWTDVVLNTWNGFEDDPDPITPGDQRIVSVGDGSTQITLITDTDIGGDAVGDSPPYDDVKTVSFNATPPCNDISGENQPYIMYVLADGKTGTTSGNYPIGPLNEIALVVDYDPGLDRLTCVPPQPNP